MNFIVSASTDIGISKSTNQDSLSVKILNTVKGRMVLAVLCDGMGGLAKGEVASAEVIRAFDAWAQYQLPQLCNGEIEDYVIRQQWQEIIDRENSKIKTYGARQGIRLGTTVVAILVTQTRFYAVNVGDSRIYQIDNALHQLTNDQTLVAFEVSRGLLTPEQAMTDPRRSVLMQCVGASENVMPEFVFGTPMCDNVFMLCSDGFRHEIAEHEIYQAFCPNALMSEEDMRRNAVGLIELNKQRQERDNISVALIRTV